ncbi:phage baseplate protein [Corallococcus sp. Z5C101001]|uniref:T4 family baseplate hub assembly chaperone n=1 Tax=Corallococcus sp. Z5C101001 TaxID=2596829 RepID=UPI00117E3B5D|nr:phage baseplate protein [Corallococcus sp. Z5C101001]TSC32929.1 phage baseplate protein [Corallococcus sp. Z5C101001]
MRSLTAPELLGAWEAGHPHSGPGRALALLCAAWPERSPGELARLPVGLRDSLLLAVREQTFGAEVVGLVPCPACGEQVELAFQVSDIRVSPGAPVPEVLGVECEGHAVRFRLPDSRDLAALAAGPEAGGRRQVLARCVVEARREGVDVETGELPAAVVRAIEEAMEAADPQARVELSTQCPACAHAWAAAFDIAEYFWREVETWAQRTLREVHTLASLYGWSEEHILVMSPWKRQRYLELAGT